MFQTTNQTRCCLPVIMLNPNHYCHILHQHPMVRQLCYHLGAAPNNVLLVKVEGPVTGIQSIINTCCFFGQQPSPSINQPWESGTSMICIIVGWLVKPSRVHLHHPSQRHPPLPQLQCVETSLPPMLHLASPVNQTEMAGKTHVI